MSGGIYLDLAEIGLVIEQPDGSHTQGTPPVLVEKDATCNDCGQRHDMEKCPKCGSDIGLGYGLMGGGIGAYSYCLEEKGPCDWIFKTFDRGEQSGADATAGAAETGENSGGNAGG